MEIEKIFNIELTEMHIKTIKKYKVIVLRSEGYNY